MPHPYLLIFILSFQIIACFSIAAEGPLKSPKIGPELHQRLEHLTQKQLQETTLNLIVRTQSPLTTHERKRLKDRGAIVHTVLVDVVTLTAPAASVYQIAELDFIVQLDLAKRMRSIHPSP